MADRALFILNPASGDHEADRTETTVVQALEDRGHEVEVRRTEGEGDARRWAGEAADDGIEVVAVAGGDGTVREAVSGIVAAEGDATLVIVPLGTANLMARALAVPVDDVAAAASLAGGRSRRLDVLHLLERDDHAVLMVDAGFDAQLVEDADRSAKDRMGSFAYVAAGLKNLFDLDEVDVTLTVDGEQRSGTAHSVLCLNVGRIGQTVVVDEGIQPDDGLVHVGVVDEPAPWQALATAVGMIAGERGNQPNLSWSTGTRVRVEATPPLDVHVDGDLAGETPIEIEVLPSAIGVFVPAEE